MRLSAKLTSEGWFLDSGLVPKTAFYHMVLVWVFFHLRNKQKLPLIKKVMKKEFQGTSLRLYVQIYPICSIKMLVCARYRKR